MEYDLLAGARELFKATYRTLARYMDERNIRLGGGAALGARWHHRESADVDLFVDEGTYRRFYDAQERVIVELERGPLAIDQLSIWPSWSRLRYVTGDVSILSWPPATREPRSGDTVRGSQVELETTTEILAKKIGGRMLRSQVIVPRDLYDLACARHFESGAIDAALDVLPATGIADIVSKLRSLPSDWMEHHREQKWTPGIGQCGK